MESDQGFVHGICMAFAWYKYLSVVVFCPDGILKEMHWLFEKEKEVGEKGKTSYSILESHTFEMIPVRNDSRRAEVKFDRWGQMKMLQGDVR